MLRILVLIILFSLGSTCLAEPVLRIFVSSSMPKPLLKSYAAEAHKYGGVLVFRGLPDGSMKKLTDLVMEISFENGIPQILQKLQGEQVVRMRSVQKYVSTSESRSSTSQILKYQRYTAGMQIDDEAFANFGVTQVPVIVLSDSEKTGFDKVTGSITIKAALELFANDGDMRGEARRLLE